MCENSLKVIIAKFPCDRGRRSLIGQAKSKGEKTRLKRNKKISLQRLSANSSEIFYCWFFSSTISARNSCISLLIFCSVNSFFLSEASVSRRLLIATTIANILDIAESNNVNKSNLWVASDVFPMISSEGIVLS
jgi:hypothetical protein